MALTDRQKEIKSLLDQGKTPKEIGKKLGISENAVYQQRRRIKAAQGNGRKAASPSPRRAGTTRKTTTTRQRPARRQQQPSPSAVNGQQEQKAADPLSEVRRRKAEIDSQLSSAKTTLDEATKAHEAAQKAYSEAEGKVRPELEQLAAVEALLTGKLKPPKPAQKAKAEKPAQKAPAQESAPPTQAASDGDASPGATPSQAEAGDTAPEATPSEATAQDEAAEAPDEPTEVQASGNGAGSEEERPGVPTLPEFAQEDAFAS